MDAFLKFLQAVADFIKNNWMALGLGVVDYEEKRVNDSKIQAEKAETELNILKANDEIDKKNSALSDDNIVANAIRKGSENK